MVFPSLRSSQSAPLFSATERVLQQHPECIPNLLIHMKLAYTNFNEIKAKILASLANKSLAAPTTRGELSSRH